MDDTSRPKDRVIVMSADVFTYEEDCPSFEDLGQDNGFRYWYARDLARCLGYESYAAFKNVINKGIAACATLNIPVDENFVQVTRRVGDADAPDYKLSRFACYLTAMNGDSKKGGVAQAQMYFAVMAESFRQYIQDANAIERLNIRDEITGRENSLSRTAKLAGVSEYALFQNAGYRGLYNKNIRDLKQLKKIPDMGRSLLDFMGKQELAANLFRITQTEAQIKGDGIRGQRDCEETAHSVGRVVRQAMMTTSKTRPEDLQLEGDIKKTKANLKKSSREFKKLDSKKKTGKRQK